MRTPRAAMTVLNGQPLNDRGVVAVRGADAGPFLQGLITNDLDGLSEQRAIFAGLLSPQGKLLFEFVVAKTQLGFLLDASANQTAHLVKRLTLYKLRAKVDIEDVSAAHSVVAVAGDGGHADPREAAMPRRLVVLREPGSFDSAFGDYDTCRIALGIPEGSKDYAFGELFPHEAMFDQLNGVSFTKGCYVGQEIVARMQHRGTARSRFLIVNASTPLPPMGTEVRAGETPLGAMGSSVGTQGLALVRLDRLGDAYKAGRPVTIGGVPVTFTKPPYATFDVPAP